jgi:hypothetical protein
VRIAANPSLRKVATAANAVGLHVRAAGTHRPRQCGFFIHPGDAAIGLPARAAAAANTVALAAASAIDLEALPFSDTPLNGALRELRFRRADFAA